MTKGKFVLKNKVSFADMRNTDVELPESDLCFQDAEYIYQFKFVHPKDGKKLEITPGTYLIVDSPNGLNLEKFEFKQRFLLESISSTSKILNEARTFFSKLHVYEKLKRPKKRGVLLYSNPGMGKTAAIEKVCLDLTNEDPGTVVLVWPTSDIEANDIVKMLSTDSKYSPECTRMVLIVEDIGGREYEGHRSNSRVESDLLNLLDGVGVIFKLPTFIIATTNYPESLLSALADRPGRFDLMLKLQPPSYEERIKLVEFLCKRPLSEEEKEALKLKEVDDFSIAHLEEVVVRAELHDKTYAQVIKELIDHRALFNRDFEEANRSIGICFD
ncbi:MAG: ATP-binding protein [Nitrososphaerales archaeon]